MSSDSQIGFQDRRIVPTWPAQLGRCFQLASSANSGPVSKSCIMISTADGAAGVAQGDTAWLNKRNKQRPQNFSLHKPSADELCVHV